MKVEEKESFGKVKNMEEEVKGNNKNMKILLFCVCCCCFPLILLVIGGVAFSLLSEEESSSVEGPDFCADLNLTDQGIRETLAANFDNATRGSGTIFYTDIELGCLPERAFSNLTLSQKNKMRIAEFLSFVEVELNKIHPKAFEEDLVEDYITLQLISNNLTELPDNVFSSFKGLMGLELGFQQFETLDNNLFGRSSSLESLKITDMEFLTSFPEMMRGTPNLVNLFIFRTEGLVNANSGAFDNANKLESIGLSSDTPVVVALGVDELKSALKLDQSVTISIE